MSYRITFEVEVLDVVADLFDSYGVSKLFIRRADHDEDEMMQATTPDHVMAVLAKDIASADTPQAAVAAMQRAHAQLDDSTERDIVQQLIVQAVEMDEAPAHGIERPRIVRKPGWPEGYWIDRNVAPTQGSGNQIRGLEQVPCPGCGAPIGEVCITTVTHGAYRKGYGHVGRRNAYRVRPV